jgi:hypothetical protein
VKYAVLIYQDERMWTEATAEQRAAFHAAHTAFDEAVRSRAQMLAGEALTGVATATTLRPEKDGRRAVTDGPYAETAEQLGGFYVVEAPDLDTMTELCALLPAGYTLEIRPVADLSAASDWLDATTG